MHPLPAADVGLALGDALSEGSARLLALTPSPQSCGLIWSGAGGSEHVTTAAQQQIPSPLLCDHSVDAFSPSHSCAGSWQPWHLGCFAFNPPLIFQHRQRSSISPRIQWELSWMCNSSLEMVSVVSINRGLQQSPERNEIPSWEERALPDRKSPPFPPKKEAFPGASESEGSVSN